MKTAFTEGGSRIGEMELLDSFIPWDINNHVVDSDPNKKEIYSRTNYIIYGDWVNNALGRSRRILKTAYSQRITFTVMDIENKGLLFDIVLN